MKAYDGLNYTQTINYEPPFLLIRPVRVPIPKTIPQRLSIPPLLKAIRSTFRLQLKVAVQKTRAKW